MNEPLSSVNVAVVQAASVLFDRDASLEKACGLVRRPRRTARNSCFLPETFIPAIRAAEFRHGRRVPEDEGRRVWQRFWRTRSRCPAR
jgi:nitrilase